MYSSNKIDIGTIKLFSSLAYSVYNGVDGFRFDAVRVLFDNL